MSTLTCAIQIGSYRILAVAAQKDTKTGTVGNLQIESEPARDCVTNGRITNVEKAAMHIRSIIQKLGNRMRATISSAYVGVGGLSLHSLVQQPSVQIPDYDVLGFDPLEDGQYQLIVGQKCIKENVQAAMARANVRVAGVLLIPNATARILSVDELQRGCVLIDMGASTTTVAVYYHGHLRHLAVIPMGGDNVTYDIQSAGCSFEEAERIKFDWSDVSQEIQKESASSNSAANALFADKALPIPQGQLNTIALCRYEELAANVLHQIELSGLKEKLEAGCIITGGATLQRGLTSLLSRRLGISRVETRAYREPAMLGSERKPHLTNALALLSFCTEDCQSVIKPANAQPKEAAPQAAAPASSTGNASAPASDGQLNLDIPDSEPEAEPESSSAKIGKVMKRFFTDLITGQD